MPTRRVSPKFLALQRKQLDARLRPRTVARLIEPPKEGWIRTIRTALGMTAAQLGRRLGTSPQAVLDLERSEAADKISLASLRKAALALGCDLVVAMVPKTSLESTVQRQAQQKAAQETNRTVHTMRLEAQNQGVERSLDPEGVKGWLTTRISRLWD